MSERIVLPADTDVSAAVELALSAAEAVARRVLRAGRRPPGRGKYASPAQRRRHGRWRDTVLIERRSKVAGAG